MCPNVGVCGGEGVIRTALLQLLVVVVVASKTTVG